MSADGTRKPISKRLRFEIFRRDNFTCRYCGLHAGEDGAELTVDHVTPFTLGGTSEPTNLVTACKDCNAGKTSIAPGSPLVHDVAQDALRWAVALAQAGESLAASREIRQAYRDAFVAKWNDYTIRLWNRELNRHVRQPLDLSPGWQQTVDQFQRAGLPVEEMTEALGITMEASNVKADNLLRYFAGVCWRKVRAMQEIARDILATDQQDQ